MSERSDCISLGWTAGFGCKSRKHKTQSETAPPVLSETQRSAPPSEAEQRACRQSPRSWRARPCRRPRTRPRRRPGSTPATTPSASSRSPTAAGARRWRWSARRGRRRRGPSTTWRRGPRRRSRGTSSAAPRSTRRCRRSRPTGRSSRPAPRSTWRRPPPWPLSSRWPRPSPHPPPPTEAAAACRWSCSLLELSSNAVSFLRFIIMAALILGMILWL